MSAIDDENAAPLAGYEEEGYEEEGGKLFASVHLQVLPGDQTSACMLVEPQH